MSNNRINDVVRFHSLPDVLAPDEEKDSLEYGRKYAKAIEYQWFNRPNDSVSMFYDRRERFHNLRLYARGEQNTEIYKRLIAGDNETSYTNYDWRPIQVAPKFINMLVNNMSERMFMIKANAVDKYSTNLRDSYRSDLEKAMVTLPILKQASQAFDINMVPENADKLPQTSEELDLRMQLEYKQAIEIATEEAIKYTLDLNDFDETQSRVIEDLASLGIGCIKHVTDPTNGIVIKAVDPAMLVHSFMQEPNGKGIYYVGEVTRIPIMEVKRLSGETFTDDQLRSFANSARKWDMYHTNFGQNYKTLHSLENIMVDVLHFTFETTNTITYKKKKLKSGGYKLTKKPSTFIKPEGSTGDYEVIKKTIKVWYEGSLVLGTDYIFNYRKCKNMVRPEGLLQEVIPNYIIYAPNIYQNRPKGLLERIIPYIDEMQQIHIKIQQIIAKARPNGVFIDVEGLSQITLGEGQGALSPLEIMRIYDDTGNVLGTSLTDEGSYNYGKAPISELKNGVIDGLDRLINAYNHYLNQVRDAIGMPLGADASTPHPDMAVGVQQQLALNSNTATRHILMAMLGMTRRLGRGISLRLKDILQVPSFKQAYVNAIGYYNMEVIKSLDKYHLHDMGVIIELKPDAIEVQTLEKNIDTALSLKEITIDDAIDIRGISNLKLANQLLKIRRARREKELKEFEMAKIDRNAESQAKAAIQVSQAKSQEFQAKASAEISVEQAKAQGQKEVISHEGKVKASLMELEFNYNMQLKSSEYQIKVGMDDKKAKDKLKAIDRNNSQMSSIQYQKAYGGQPLNFESAEDHISGGINLGDMDPS